MTSDSNGNEGGAITTQEPSKEDRYILVDLITGKTLGQIIEERNREEREEGGTMNIVGTATSLKAARMIQDSMAEQGKWKVIRLDGDLPVYGKGNEELSIEEEGGRVFKVIRKEKGEPIGN